MAESVDRHNKIVWAMASVAALLPFARFIMPSSFARLFFYIGLSVLGLSMGVYIFAVGGRKVRIDKLTVVFLAICGMSICFSPYSERFMAWERLAAFVVLLCVTGPLLLGSSLRLIRRRAFSMIGIICVLCSLYYNGLYVFMVTHYCAWMSRYAWVYTYSISISMLYSALCAVGALYMGWLLLKLGGESERKGKGRMYLGKSMKCIITAGSFLSCVNAMLLASSRSAIVAFAAAFMLMCGLCWWRQRKLPKVWAVGVALISIFCIISVIIPMTPIMQGKFRNIARHDGDYMASRRSLWGDREEEITSYRLFGTGFACVAPESVNSYNPSVSHSDRSDYSVEPSSGVVEPGSSWLFVLSSTGVPGMVVFTVLLGWTFMISFRGKPLFTALLLFFGLHMMAEGYVLSSGALVAYIFWLVMGISRPSRSLKEDLVELAKPECHG